MLEYDMGCGVMEDGVVEDWDTEVSVESGAGVTVKELTTEEQAEEEERGKFGLPSKESTTRKLQTRYREWHPTEVNARNDTHYQDNKPVIRASQNDRNTQLRLTRVTARQTMWSAHWQSTPSSSSSVVRAGCRLECSPGHCTACWQQYNEGLHPVHARILAVY